MQKPTVCHCIVRGQCIVAMATAAAMALRSPGTPCWTAAAHGQHVCQPGNQPSHNAVASWRGVARRGVGCATVAGA